MAIRLHSLNLGVLGVPTLFACLGMAVLASGCPNPEDRYNEFLEATKDERLDAGGDGDPGDGDPGDGDGDPDESPIPADLDGTYLFALETSLGPDLPLQFVTTISNTVIAEDGSGATADFSFQPLTLNQGESLIPRECLAEMLTFEDVAFDAEGNFEIDMGLVMVSGVANPVTGGDIEATILVMGHIVHDTAMCGEFSGMLMSPLEYDLAGSTFAAIKLDDNGCMPETLPVSFPYKCDMVPPPDAPDYSGYYLFALETSLGPDLPLQFVTTVVYTAAEDGSGLVDLSFQPLSLNQGETMIPREYIGEPLVFEDIPVTPEGTFDVDMGLVMVTGAANPVTGGDIEATILVHAEIRDEDHMCGEFEGMLMSPLEYDLAGSTFGAMRLADDGSDPMTLPAYPDFPYKCSQL
jgi:hypothetical protein